MCSGVFGNLAQNKNKFNKIFIDYVIIGKVILNPSVVILYSPFF